MKGSIRERKSTSKKGQSGPQVWEIQVYHGIDPATGRRLRHFETVKGKQAVAEKRLRKLLVELDDGTFAPTPAKLTLGQVLKSWLEGYVRTNCAERTREGYETICRIHLVPSLGTLPLKAVTVPMIESFYGRMLDKGLTHNTVHHLHQVLNEALKWAVRNGVTATNPCSLAIIKVPRKNVMRTLTPSELATLLDGARESYYLPVVFTAVSSGLRQSELLGLRWRDVDLDLCTISVNQVLHKRGGKCLFKVPKTAHSRRRLDMTPKLAVFLREYKARREVIYLELGRILSLDGLVFESVNFEPLNPSVVGHNFHALTVKVGLKGVRFHDLRHTFASLMLLRGVAPKVISEALGHASVAFTMDTYSHILEGMQRDAMAVLDDVLPDVSRRYNGELTAKNKS